MVWWCVVVLSGVMWYRMEKSWEEKGCDENMKIGK